MGIGTAESQRTLAQAPREAFLSAREALESIGKLKEVDEQGFFLRGSTRYGLQKVRLKVFIEADEAGSTVRVKALADDVWGKGARKGCERFLQALGG